MSQPFARVFGETSVQELQEAVRGDTVTRVSAAPVDGPLSTVRGGRRIRADGVAAARQPAP